MIISELFGWRNHNLLTETVFDVLDDAHLPNFTETLSALVMYVTINNNRPGILQLKSFYLRDNKLFLDELSRIADNHPRDYETAREFVSRRGIDVAKQYVRRFFDAKQNNVDLAPQPRVQGAQMPQRPVGGDRGRMRIAGR